MNVLLTECSVGHSAEYSSVEVLVVDLLTYYQTKPMKNLYVTRNLAIKFDLFIPEKILLLK